MLHAETTTHPSQHSAKAEGPHSQPGVWAQHLLPRAQVPSLFFYPTPHFFFLQVLLGDQISLLGSGNWCCWLPPPRTQQHRLPHLLRARGDSQEHWPPLPRTPSWLQQVAFACPHPSLNHDSDFTSARGTLQSFCRAPMDRWPCWTCQCKRKTCSDSGVKNPGVNKGSS